MISPIYTCKSSPLTKLIISFILIVISFLFTGCEKKLKYDDALAFSEGMAAIKTNGFYGYVDENLNTVIKPEYYQAKSFHNGVALVKKGSNWGAIDKNNEVIIPFKYKNLQTFSKDLIVVNNYSKFGCIDYTGKVVIDFKYDNIELYTYYKETNTTLPAESLFNLNESYKDLTAFNFALTYLDDKVGFIDLQDYFTIEPNYSDISISPTDNTILSLTSDYMYGFADLINKTIVEPKFYYPIEFSEGLAAARNPDLSQSHLQLYGFIDKTGTFVIEPTYSYAANFSNGLAPVKDFIQPLVGYINTAGEYIIPPTFNKALPFHNGSAIVKYLGKYTMINTTGEYITDDSFYDINFPRDDSFYDSTLGFALYKNESGDYSTAAINNLGKTLFYTTYDYMGSFQKETCIVGQNNKYGMINTRGIEVVPIIYDNISLTTLNNIFIAVSNGKTGIITSDNIELLPCSYDSIEIKNNAYLLLLKDNKYGVYHLQNNTLIEPDYDEVRLSFDSNIISVRKNTEWFFIDNKGTKVK